MTKKIELKASTRKKEEKNVNEIRKAGFVPGVIYGSGIKNVALKVNGVELEKVFQSAGESTLVDLKIDDSEPTKVIIKDVQNDVLKDRIMHVDFYQVDMKNKIEVEVPFVFVGEAKAEKEQGAVILKNMESVLIKCLPGDLIDHIKIDLGKLEKIGDSIKISDLELPDNFELMSDSGSAIVNATEQKIEEEPEEEVAPEESSEEGEEGDKKEEENKEEEKK